MWTVNTWLRTTCSCMLKRRKWCWKMSHRGGAEKLSHNCWPQIASVACTCTLLFFQFFRCWRKSVRVESRRRMPHITWSGLKCGTRSQMVGAVNFCIVCMYSRCSLNIYRHRVAISNTATTWCVRYCKSPLSGSLNGTTAASVTAAAATKLSRRLSVARRSLHAAQAYCTYNDNKSRLLWQLTALPIETKQLSHARCSRDSCHLMLNENLYTGVDDDVSQPSPSIQPAYTGKFVSNDSRMDPDDRRHVSRLKLLFGLRV